jgi:hypothetical protein
VAEQHARHRVTDDVAELRLVHEAVAAVAGVFGAAIPFGHCVHAMAEQPAQVPDLLREAVAPLIRIGVAPEQQWMPAPDARVFGVAVPPTDLLIGVVAQEARQGVTDPDRFPIVAKHRHAAPGAVASRAGERPVVDRVSPDRTPEPDEHSRSLL